jgi:hypothetical protein
MSEKSDIEKIISIAGEAIGALFNYDRAEGARLFIEMSEVLLGKETGDSNE